MCVCVCVVENYFEENLYALHAAVLSAGSVIKAKVFFLFLLTT